MKKLLFLILFGFTWVVSAQQEAKKIDLKQGSIAEKFDKIYQKSGKYKQYKVVEHNLLLDLKKQVTDSLTKEKKRTAAAKAQILALQNKISNLKKDLSTKEQKILSLSAEKQSIDVGGMSLAKEKFKLIVWLVLLVLLVALLYFIYAFRSSITATREAKKSLARIEEEYYGFKTQALEREQSLKRQLLDEQKKHQ